MSIEISNKVEQEIHSSKQKQQNKINENSDANLKEKNDMFIKYPGYKRLYECFIELAKTDEQKEAIEQIMKNGEYNGFKLNTMLSNEAYNDRTERNRRINFSEIILFDNDLFNYLASNGLNVFHGTEMKALETILSKGLAY